MTNPLIDDTGSLGYSDIISTYLSQWGLTSLIPLVDKLGQTGASNAQISLQIQQSQAYKTRFSANDARIANGLAALSPAEYIALEGQYRQTLMAYGMPKGFYDDQATLDKWIGDDVSPSEMASRAKAASDLIYNSPPQALQEWNKYYGGSGTGGAIATILDPGVAEPLIQNQVTAAQIGGAAAQQNLNLNAQRAMQFAQNGVTLQSAQKSYQDIATRLAGDTAMSNRFSGQQAAAGTQQAAFGQTQEENAAFLNSADAQRQQATLYSEQQSQFAGHGGASDASGNPGSNY